MGADDRAAISALVLEAMGTAWSDSEEYSALPGVVADLVLMSDWLTALIARIASEAAEAAWDRGYRSGANDAMRADMSSVAKNPYRADRLVAERRGKR